ncbi:MAG TPA: heme-binding protein [Vicinamibacterales bacterium]|nr:heme-binding protein [Vicinamibacterales bacterium]
MKRVAAMLFVAAIVSPPVAWAQGSSAIPLDKATVSKEVAQRTLMKNQISATVARQIVDACVDFARNQQGGPGNYAIFVLAPNGDIVDAHVMDGVMPIGVETGLLKAKTALYARTPSSAVAQRFSDVDGRVIRLDLGKESGLAYYFVGGGLPIVVENNLIGAIGVGGGNMDEQCAYQALTKVLGPQPPLPTPAGRGAPSGGAAPAGGRGGRGQ